MQTDLRGAIEIEWESDRDLRCCKRDCIQPVKHRIIGYKEVYMCDTCFKMDDWRKDFPNGIEFDVSERGLLKSTWTSQDTSTNLSELWF